MRQHPPVNNDLLQPRPVVIESYKVNAADVALVEGGLVRATLVVIGGLQVGAVARPVHKHMDGVAHTHLHKDRSRATRERK